jgi:hypothetical protein
MTYEQMRERIRPEQYEVVRRVSGTAKMVTGLRGTPTYREWEEPSTWATIFQRDPKRVVATSIGLNAMYLCLPDGHSKQAMTATDEEIILAVVGDESIF